MTTIAITSFVFVDFENVPSVDLALVAGKPVHVTLLIGKNQGKIEFALVEQIHQLSEQVSLVKLDASGRNALDLTLAHYLGRAVERMPDGHFSVVSKDKDFDPMIAHLVGKGVKMVRCEGFAALPFLPKPKKIHPAKSSAPTKAGVLAKNVEPVKAAESDERLEKLITRLKNNPAKGPKKKSSLLAYINTAFSGKLSVHEQESKLTELIKRGVLTINEAGKVTYL